MQGGYTKYSCFLCEWDSRADADHYTKKDWPVRQSLTPGTKNVINQPLVDREKILMPPLHLKLGLCKQFVKALYKNGEPFTHLKALFPRLSAAKLEGGIFTGPDIRLMLASNEFSALMSDVEKRAWESFRQVVKGFLGNRKVDNYKQATFSKTIRP